MKHANWMSLVVVALGCLGPLSAASSATTSPAQISTSFGASTIPLHGSTSVSFVISNPNLGTGLTSIGFTDTLPSGLVVSTPSSLSNGCGGTATANAGTSSVSLSSGTLGPGDVCVVSLNVTGTTAGEKGNYVIVGSSAGSGNTATAVVTVVAPPEITEVFPVGSSWIPLGSTTSVRFVLDNPNAATQLTGVGFTETLPPGLTVATPDGLSGSCGGGTITGAPGGSTISLAGATLTAPPDPASSCGFDVNVTGSAEGFEPTTTGAVASNEGGSGNAGTASISVVGAGGRVYWTNLGTTVSFARLNGEVGTPFEHVGGTTTGIGVAIASAAGRLYWTDSTNNKIHYASLDGSNPGDFSAPSDPQALAIDPNAGRIYWTSLAGNQIRYANLDGTGGGVLTATGATVSDPGGVALDLNHGRIYWTNNPFEVDGHSPDSISYANLDGSGGHDLTISGTTVGAPEGLAIEEATGRIYWTKYATNKISYANLDGSGGGDLAITGVALSSPWGLAIDPDANKIYWGNHGSNQIAYANLDGSGGGVMATPGASTASVVDIALLEPPVGVGAPAVTGGSTTGSTLSCSQGAWAADLVGSSLYRAPQSLTYQWSLNGADLAGATGATYNATSPGDYRCRVTAQNNAGTAVQTSTPLAVAAPPPPPTCQSVTATATTGQPMIVALTCSDSTGAALTYALDSSPAHGALSAFNAHTGEVTYTSAAGYAGADSFAYHATSANGTAAVQTVTITVKRSSGGSPAATTPPVITHASLSHRRFRVAPGATAISAKAPLGTSFRFTLSAVARVQITLTHQAPGLRSGRRCVAPSPKLRRAHAKGCTRTLTVGRLTRANEPAGADSVPFTGRVGRRALPPGAYHAVLVATDAGRSSPPVTLAFTVLR